MLENYHQISLQKRFQHELEEAAKKNASIVAKARALTEVETFYELWVLEK